jgi:formate dehydrogenase subunit beta
MKTEEQIRKKARELLTDKVVDCVIGYERATDGVTARPFFAYTPEETDRFIFDETCAHNLTRYLLNRKGKTTGIVVKPCDSRAINLLINESQIERDKIFVIGVACPGLSQKAWKRPGADLLPACQSCRQHTPVLYDFLAGEPAAEPELPEPYPDVAEMEAKSPEERRAFWQEQFSRCIRCNACRQVCPGCYCPECFADRLDPLWVGIRIAPPENEMWNFMRAFHLAGRCIGCYQCERVCPVHIPLSLLNRKLEKECLDMFGFEAGIDAAVEPPFATFKKDEKLGVGGE